jgi:hypothetical protein
VIWQECEEIGTMPIETRLEVCFPDISIKGHSTDRIPLKDVIHSPFTSVYSPSRLNGHLIFMEKLWNKFYVNYLGRKMGPVYEYVAREGCCENGYNWAYSGDDYYYFRGKRDGKFYWVMISIKPDIGSD